MDSRTNPILPSLIGAVLVLGIANPLIAWLILNWVTRIENARLYVQADRRALHLETASLVGQRMTSLLDLDSLLTEVVKLIRAKFGYYHANLFLTYEDTREIVLKEADGPSAELMKARGVRLKIGEEGITGWVASTGQTLVCNDVTQEPRYYQSGTAARVRKPNWRFPCVWENASLAFWMCRAIGTMPSIREMSLPWKSSAMRWASPLKMPGCFKRPSTATRRWSPCTKPRWTSLPDWTRPNCCRPSCAGAAALGSKGGPALPVRCPARFDPYHRQLQHRSGFFWRDSPPGRRSHWSGHPDRQADDHNDYWNWAGHAVAFEGATENHIVGVPLEWEAQIIGGIDILDDPDGRPFDSNDIWLLSQFADLASIAVKNAELHTQIKQFSQELEQKVAKRTAELSRAKDEIAVRAERLRSLWDKTIRLQEEERARIARDMHDSIIQLITAARLELKATRVVAASGLPPLALEKMDALREILDEMEKELRRAIYDLQPPMLDAVGLMPALQNMSSPSRRFPGLRAKCSSPAPHTVCHPQPRSPSFALWRKVYKTYCRTHMQTRHQ